jgi:hypothetical protein
MQCILLSLSTILIISCIIPICSLHAQYEIGAWVVGSGGGESSNDSHMVISALGQPLTGIKQNNSFLVQSGFMYVASASIITSVEQRDDYISTKFNLEQNFPNPFNPSTTIGFSIPERTSVSLDLYNALGQRVAGIINDEVSAGTHEVTFDASHLPNGVYIYRLRAGDYVESKKLLLLK